MSAAPASVLVGIRSVDIDGVVVREPTLVEGFWASQVEISLDGLVGASSPVPSQSRWFLVVGETYPFGEVKLYPAKVGGLGKTFPHQDINLRGSAEVPWRTGKICLERPIRGMQIAQLGNDPVGNREERIRWYLLRAVQWLRAADAGRLAVAGDPFELPYCPSKAGLRVIHDESPETFTAWSGKFNGSWGQFVWDTVPELNETARIVAFMEVDAKAVVRPSPSYDDESHGPANRERQLGVWWLWPEPVVLEPWQVPTSWEALRKVGEGLSSDVDGTLRKIARTIRGREIPLVLIGYPIPKRQGEAASEVHWQALKLPLLKKGAAPKGFRNNDQGYWHRDRRTVFSGKLEYWTTGNRHSDRLQARGRLRKPLRESRIALIGCGALGSLVAELLVRGGAKDTLIVDPDILSAGNLVRHSLSGRHIGESKAVALAKKLTAVAPFASVRSAAKALPTLPDELQQILDDRDVIVDCTASDVALLALAQGWWGTPKLFVSASVGYEAQRLFLYAHRGPRFPRDHFEEVMASLLSEERDAWGASGETIEGAGCWSPLFPARLDDVMLAAVASVKTIEELLEQMGVQNTLIVYEQEQTDTFMGFKRVDSPSPEETE